MAKRYTDDKKAAVMAALLAGQSISAVAREYNIPKGTVGGWKKKLTAHIEISERDATQKTEIGGMLLALLGEQVKALRSWLDSASDPDWVRKQNAADLAVLFGVNYDKMVRMIEALSHAADDR